MSMRRNRSTVLAGALLSSAVFLFFLRDRRIGRLFHDPSAFINGFLCSLQSSRGGNRGAAAQSSSRYPQTRLRTAQRDGPEAKILWPHRGMPGPTFDTAADILTGTGEEDGTWIAEWKYDGERFQVHNDGNGAIELFSLSGNNVTERHLDLVCELRDALADESVPCVLEGEVVAFSTTDGYEFDIKALNTRIQALQKGLTPAIPVRARLFDCLFYKEDVSSQTKEDRFRMLQQVLKDEVLNSDEHHSQVKLGKRVELDSDRLSESLEETFREATKEPSIRGVIVKNCLSSYQARNASQWMTIRKNDHQVGAGSETTVDAVAVGLKRGQRMGQPTEKVIFLVGMRKEEGQDEAAAASESDLEGQPTEPE